MDIKMNGKKIKSIWFNGADGDMTISAGAPNSLTLSAIWHGDRDEFWVIESFNGKELARFNCRDIASIVWADE